MRRLRKHLRQSQKKFMANKTIEQNIPEHWQLKKLNDLGMTYSGLRGKSKLDFGTGSRFITYMNVFSNSKIDLNKFDLVSVNDNENQNKVKCGDIFFTISSETPEEVGMSSVLLDQADYYLNSFCFGYRLNDFNDLTPQYARYLFRGNDFRAQIVKMAQGSTRFNLSKERVLNLNVALPSLKEQQKIAGILETVDADIEETKSVIKATEKLKKGLMQDLFTRGIGHTKFKQTELGEIPDSWSICPLNSIATVVDSLHKTPKFAEEGYSMVRVSDIKTGNLNLSTALRVPEEVYKEFTSNYIPKKGDLVLSRVGSYGVVSYVATEEKFCMGQNTVVINCDLDSKYVYFALNSDLVKNQIENQVAGSGYKSLSLKSIRELKVPVPVNGEEIRISEILSSVDEKVAVNKKILAKQTELKKGLMQDLLSGIKRVSLYE